MPVSNDELIQAIMTPMSQALGNEKITPTYLAKKLKRELNAKEIKAFHGKDGIEYSNKLVAWSVRQKARQDAHKLLNHYPAEKFEMSGMIEKKIDIPDDLKKIVKDACLKFGQILRNNEENG